MERMKVAYSGRVLGGFVLEPMDDLYPLPRLKDAPTLYGVGDPSALEGASVLVTGSRKATAYGLECAESAAADVAAAGLALLSPGALGCCTAAVEGALGAGGRVVVVPAGAADVAYPPGNAELFWHVAREGGCLVSPFPFGTQPAPATMAGRNGVLAGLCSAAVVAEAGLPSGVFSLAADVAGRGKPVYAYPGSVFSLGSRGTNRLVAEGATILDDPRALAARLEEDLGAPRKRGFDVVAPRPVERPDLDASASETRREVSAGAGRKPRSAAGSREAGRRAR